MTVQGAGLCSACSPLSLTPAHSNLWQHCGRNSTDRRRSTACKATSAGAEHARLLQRLIPTSAASQPSAAVDSGNGRAGVVAGSCPLPLRRRHQIRSSYKGVIGSRPARRSGSQPPVMAAGTAGAAGASADAYQPPIEELAQDAVVWATQHGLVRPCCSARHCQEPVLRSASPCNALAPTPKPTAF